MPSELSKRQERAIDRVARCRSEIEAARTRAEQAAWTAVRRDGVPVRVLADRLGVTRQRIYQMVKRIDALDL